MGANRIRLPDYQVSIPNSLNGERLGGRAPRTPLNRQLPRWDLPVFCSRDRGGAIGGRRHGVFFPFRSSLDVEWWVRLPEQGR